MSTKVDDFFVEQAFEAVDQEEATATSNINVVPLKPQSKLIKKVTEIVPFGPLIKPPENATQQRSSSDYSFFDKYSCSINSWKNVKKAPPAAVFNYKPHPGAKGKRE